MGRTSGKCDFHDSISIDLDRGSTWDKILSTYTVEKYNTDGTKTKLEFHKKEDFIPYYPYIICAAACSDEHTYILLSAESYVDTENKMLCNLYIDSFKRFQNKQKRKCKKEGREFDIDTSFQEWLTEENSWLPTDPAYKDAVKQAIQCNFKKDKATGNYKIKYQYSRIAQHYRSELRKEMINNGLNPEDYGY